MPSISEQLVALETQKQKLLKRLQNVRANKTFECLCGSKHKIKDCIVIQTHWYVSPQGCTGGDYWNEGELQIICPDKPDHRNRILFNDSTWKTAFRFNLEKQFKSMYKSLFKEVKDEYKEQPYYWANNYYFEKNQKKFDLERKKD